MESSTPGSVQSSRAIAAQVWGNENACAVFLIHHKTQETIVMAVLALVQHHHATHVSSWKILIFLMRATCIESASPACPPCSNSPTIHRHLTDTSPTLHHEAHTAGICLFCFLGNSSLAMVCQPMSSATEASCCPSCSDGTLSSFFSLLFVCLLRFGFCCCSSILVFFGSSA